MAASSNEISRHPPSLMDHPGRNRWYRQGIDNTKSAPNALTRNQRRNRNRKLRQKQANMKRSVRKSDNTSANVNKGTAAPRLDQHEESDDDTIDEKFFKEDETAEDASEVSFQDSDAPKVNEDAGEISFEDSNAPKDKEGSNELPFEDSTAQMDKDCLNLTGNHVTVDNSGGISNEDCRKDNIQDDSHTEQPSNSSNSNINEKPSTESIVSSNSEGQDRENEERNEVDKNTSSPADVKCSSNEEESHVENNSSDPTIDHCAKSPTENEGVKDFDKSSQNKDDESEKNGKDDLCMESTATRDINDDVKNSTPASSKTESSDTSNKHDSGSEPPTTSQPADNCKNLWVTGISSTVNAKDIKALFIKYGKVVGAKIISNSKSSSSRRYGFVMMATPDDASKCIQNLHRSKLNGQTIFLKLATIELPIAKKKGEELQPEASQGLEPEKNEILAVESKTASPVENEATAKVDQSTEPSATVDQSTESSATVDQSTESSAKVDQSAESSEVEVIFIEKKVNDNTKHAEEASAPNLEKKSTTVKDAEKQRRQLQSAAKNATTREQQDRDRLKNMERSQREEAKRLRVERQSLNIERKRLMIERENLRFEREQLEHERRDLEREKERQRLQKDRLQSEWEQLKRMKHKSQLEDSHQTKRPYEESFSGWQMDDESHKRLKHAADPLHFLDPSNRSTDGVAMPRNANFNDNWKSLMDLRRDGGSCSATNVSSIDASFMENLKNAWHRHISLLQNPEGGSRSHFSGSIVSRSNNNRDDYGHLESHSIGIENHGRRRNVAEDDDSRQHMLANYLMLKELSYRDSAQRTDQGGEHSSYPSNRYDPYLSMRRFE